MWETHGKTLKDIKRGGEHEAHTNFSLLLDNIDDVSFIGTIEGLVRYCPNGVGNSLVQSMHSNYAREILPIQPHCGSWVFGEEEYP